MREVELWIRKTFRRVKGRGLLDSLVDAGLKLLEQLAKHTAWAIGVALIGAMILEDILDGEPFLWREI